MDREQRIAFVNTQIVCANCELAAMHVANMESHKAGGAMVYHEKDFLELPNRYMIGHNAVIDYLNT